MVATNESHKVHESIEVRSSPPIGKWKPVVGLELQSLIIRKKLSTADSQRVEEETCRILSKCIAPTGQSGQTTGLVVGYVQSGKTLSFTALAALARDNAYRLIIVLGGTTTNLVGQSFKRLTDDLNVDEQGRRIWTMLVNPNSQAENVEEVDLALRSWTAYPGRADRCQTVLLVVMKYHIHLVKLQKLLEQCELTKVSALVIDDEGDQAGLNNKVREQDESTTYTCIRLLRKVLPTHTYLLYTATPQAPLLISRIDMLSPEFADPIEPGFAYIGGKDLFKEKSPYIEIIPTHELPDDNAPPEPPDSLKKALRLFFIGVAVGCLGTRDGNRSMMIHPSSRRDWHQQFVAWVRSAKTTWVAVLGDNPNSPDRRELIEAFREDYVDLGRTNSDLPSFEQILEELAYAIGDTQIKEVNARNGRIPTVLWNRKYSYILVGGTGLDRGFTVEGLTVTYMPRGAGVGNADTIQQRGRFFGYKRSYLGFVRIFLEQTVESAFRKYVMHEQSIRKTLASFRETGKSLKDWRRAFFLDRSMSPTRASVLALDYMRGRSRDWIYPRTPHISKLGLIANQEVLSNFLLKHSKGFREDSGSASRTKEQIHNVNISLSLETVYRELLVPMTATGDDLLDHIHLLLQIERELDRKLDGQIEGEHPVAGCEVYVMSKGAERGAVRELQRTNQGSATRPKQQFRVSRRSRDQR